MKTFSEKNCEEVIGTEDNEIVGLFYMRNEKAIEETGGKYGGLMKKISRNILKDPRDAEECYNDSLCAVWNAIPPAKPDSLAAFLCRLTRNTALKKVAFLTRKKRCAAEIPLSELETVLSDKESERFSSDGEIAEKINDFLRLQKEDVRNIFIRRYFLFESVSEIAERYSFTGSKVKNVLYHARQRLKEYLIREGAEI